MGHRALPAGKASTSTQARGEVFATLTGGSFGDLRVKFDESDNAQLAGLRAGGELARVGGMSTGTADQPYVALQVASIEDYLNRAQALPFVADDLFINFDNDRAAAGFESLANWDARRKSYSSSIIDI